MSGFYPHVMLQPQPVQHQYVHYHHDPAMAMAHPQWQPSQFAMRGPPPSYQQWQWENTERNQYPQVEQHLGGHPFTAMPPPPVYHHPRAHPIHQHRTAPSHDRHHMHGTSFAGSHPPVLGPQRQFAFTRRHGSHAVVPPSPHPTRVGMRHHTRVLLPMEVLHGAPRARNRNFSNVQRTRYVVDQFMVSPLDVPIDLIDLEQVEDSLVELEDSFEELGDDLTPRVIPSEELAMNSELVTYSRNINNNNTPGQGCTMDDTCVICLANFEDGDPMRRLNVCRHAFHTSCIDRWLSSSDTCPVCKRDIAAAADI